MYTTNIPDGVWDSGCTCHSDRLWTILYLLWHCNDRNYSFFMETFVNQQKDWVMVVVPQLNEQVRSWQNFSFTTKKHSQWNLPLYPNFLGIEKEKQKDTEEKKQQRKLTDIKPSTTIHHTLTRGASVKEEDVLVQQ